jgi:hypothetical protein
VNASRKHRQDNTESDSSPNDHDGESLFFEPQRGMKRETNLSDRRTPARLQQEDLLSNLGPILDLSVGGMRVLCKRSREGSLKVRLWAYQFTMNLDGQVVWTKHLGFRRHEIGVEFLNVDDDTAKILARVSAIHRMRRAI